MRIVPSAEPLAVVRMKLVGANAAAKLTGLAELPGKSNYFIGDDPKKWRTNVPNYAKVKYTSVCPGVDLVYYGNQRQLEYDFVVQPGADARQIALQLVAPASSRDAARWRRYGSTRMVTWWSPPKMAQCFPQTRGLPAATDNGPWTNEEKQRTKDKQSVGGNYVLKDDRLTFEVASYDLGGTSQEFINGLAIDASGNAYVSGSTASTNFPTTPGAFQPTYGGGTCRFPPCFNGFVSKLNSAGSALVYSTYLGGNGGGAGNPVVDASGNVYVGGATSSSDFPTTPGAFQTSKPSR